MFGMEDVVLLCMMLVELEGSVGHGRWKMGGMQVMGDLNMDLMDLKEFLCVLFNSRRVQFMLIARRELEYSVWKGVVASYYIWWKEREGGVLKVGAE